MGGSRHVAAAALAMAMIWGWAGGAAAVEIATVAKTGDVAPGAGGATFTNFRAVVLNGAGAAAFRGTLSGGGEGLWRSGPAGLALVAKTGDAAPGAGGATFTDIGVPVLNGAGEVAFGGFLSGGGEGIWRSGPAGLALVARTGDVAPGAGGATFTFFDSPFLNGAGEVAFRGFLGPSFTDPGIWVGGPAGLALVARSGDAAPGAGGATFADFLVPVLNGAGEVAFLGFLGAGFTDPGIWRSGPAGLALVAKTGDTAPGAGGATFSDFNLPALNGAGEVAFSGRLSGGGEGIWRRGPAGLALVAKAGDLAPGAGGATFEEFPSPVLNGAGEVAFRGELSGGEGLWAGPSGGLQLVVRDGDDIEVAPGDSRTVSFLSLSAATGNEDGQPSGFSEGGQVAFRAEFTDGSMGLFLSPPEAPTVHRVPQRAVDGAWGPVMLPKSFTKPVIVAGPASSANKQPGVVRLREIEGAEGRFEARFQEWRYLDGKHPQERADFLALERGRHKQDDGSLWEAGTVKVKGNRAWKKKKFAKRFRRPPQVFATVQSSKGKTAVAARVRNVTKKGFEVSIQEEEKDLRGKHPKETVGYLAVFSAGGRGTIAGGVDGTDYSLKRTKVKHRFKNVPGGALKLEEEKSKDKERRHKKEAVSVLSLGQGLFAQQASDKEPDTTALRRR